MKMIRKSQLNLNYLTNKKKSTIVKIIHEHNRLVNLFIKYYWKISKYSIYLLSKKHISQFDTWLSQRLVKRAAKKAIEICKSVKNKRWKNKSKSEKKCINKIPEFKGLSISLDADFLRIKESETSHFDLWLHLSSIGQKIIFDLPSKRHRHWNKPLSKGFAVKNSGNLRMDKEGRLWLDVIFEKEIEDGYREGNHVLGIDLGINKLFALSEGFSLGERFKTLQQELFVKQQYSKSWYKKAEQIKNYIRQMINLTGLQQYDTIVMEDLRKISNKTRGKLNKVTRKFLSYWNRQVVYQQIGNICQENRVRLAYVSPAYTSQTCPICGHVDKRNRSGERFKCLSCGHENDADINGAINIKMAYEELTVPHVETNNYDQ